MSAISWGYDGSVFIRYEIRRLARPADGLRSLARTADTPWGKTPAPYSSLFQGQNQLDFYVDFWDFF
ncbi:MAG: hypothetical protein EB830_06620 [Nitrosopumilus sp. H13]|nr:MAG: hypothetical protein EB830_06620 [Nitrosopumilus sp. H13]